MTQPYHLSIQDAAEQIRTHKLSVTEWVSSCLARIAEIDPILKAWVYLDPQKAREQASLIDQALSSSIPAQQQLWGAPIGIKDIFNTTDMPTCMGSPLWAGFTPGNDARIVFYLRENLGIILGKTSTAEFAVHALSETLNPYDFSKTPGTSSSGSAVAVATGMCPAALGSQTAGSIIRPASFCGIYGYKPSFGLIPRTGTLKTTDTLDTIGFFARCVKDLEILLDVLRVHGSNYPYIYSRMDQNPHHRSEGQPWKIGLVTTRTSEFAEDYAQKEFTDWVNKLSRMPNLSIEPITLDGKFDSAHDIHAVIYEKTLAYYFKEEFKQNQLISEILRNMIQRGNRLALTDYLHALNQQKELASNLDSHLSEFDILITLSTAGAAPDRKVLEKEDSCLLWTLCGVPAMSIPLFKSPAALPFGLQIVARRYNDGLLFDFAKHLLKAGLISDSTVFSPQRLT